VDRAQKKELVDSLNKELSGTEVVVVALNKGLTVAEITDLRRQMRSAGASFKVSKNRLTNLALEGTKYKSLSKYLKGPTGIAYSNDPVAAAKVATDFAKKNDKFEVLGGAMGDTLLDVNGVKALASLPSLDELRGKIVGLIQAPATKVAGVLAAPAGQLARVLSARAKQGEAA
jgi:large subunit ribosomal protein L10